MIGCVHNRTNVGSYLIKVEYDQEENSIVVLTSTGRFVLDTSHHKEADVRELVDLFDSMRHELVKRAKLDDVEAGVLPSYFYTGPQANPPAKELWYER